MHLIADAKRHVCASQFYYISPEILASDVDDRHDGNATHRGDYYHTRASRTELTVMAPSTFRRNTKKTTALEARESLS